MMLNFKGTVDRGWVDGWMFGIHYEFSIIEQHENNVYVVFHGTCFISTLQVKNMTKVEISCM